MTMKVPVGYRRNLDTVTTDFPSDAIWHKMPVPFEQAVNEPSWGRGFHDDFNGLPLAPTLTTQIAFGRYKAYAASGCTINRVSSINSTETFGGALAITMDTDDDEAALGEAYNTYRLSGAASSSGPLLFEFCYAQNSIATNMAAVFVGLAETDAVTFGANTPFNSGDAITNTWAGIGFRIEEDGLGVVDTVVTDRATSFTNIGDTEGGTLAANTFDTFGIVYDPYETDNCVTFYKNNRPLTTRYSRSTLTGLTNLDAGSVGPMIAVAADSAGTSFAAYLKWWRVFQLAPGIRLQHK
jgi:hypothetical protein